MNQNITNLKHIGDCLHRAITKLEILEKNNSGAVNAVVSDIKSDLISELMFVTELLRNEYNDNQPHE